MLNGGKPPAAIDYRASAPCGKAAHVGKSTGMLSNALLSRPDAEKTTVVRSDATEATTPPSAEQRIRPGRGLPKRTGDVGLAICGGCATLHNRAFFDTRARKSRTALHTRAFFAAPQEEAASSIRQNLQRPRIAKQTQYRWLREGKTKLVKEGKTGGHHIGLA